MAESGHRSIGITKLARSTKATQESYLICQAHTTRIPLAVRSHMFSAVEHYPNHAPPAPAQWPTALRRMHCALRLRDRDTRWKFAIRPTRKQLRAADPFIWDATMKCALEWLSGHPLISSRSSLSPYYPKLRALAFSHRRNQNREATCLSSTISIEQSKLLMLGYTTIIGIC